MHLNADEVLHVGDDPERDWKAAAAAGLLVFRLDRPRNSLRDLLTTSVAVGQAHRLPDSCWQAKRLPYNVAISSDVL